jgi:hypothetical protein
MCCIGGIPVIANAQAAARISAPMGKGIPFHGVMALLSKSATPDN